MNREDLEHLIRAAATVTNEYEFVIVGSQSILGSIPYPPAELKMSAEADIYPLNAEDKSIQIEGALGEGSQFHATFDQAVDEGAQRARLRASGRVTVTSAQTYRAERRADCHG